MRLHHFEDEQVVLLNKTRIDEPAFEVRKALLDERSLNHTSFLGRELEFRKLVDITAGSIADSDNYRCHIRGRDVDHAFFAFPDHFKAVVLIPDVTADERGLASQDHVPTHCHDIPPAPPSRTHQNDRTGLEKTADFRNRKIFFLIRFANALHIHFMLEEDGANNMEFT